MFPLKTDLTVYIVSLPVGSASSNTTVIIIINRVKDRFSLFSFYWILLVNKSCFGLKRHYLLKQSIHCNIIEIKQDTP